MVNKKFKLNIIDAIVVTSAGVVGVEPTLTVLELWVISTQTNGAFLLNYN